MLLAVQHLLFAQTDTPVAVEPGYESSYENTELLIIAVIALIVLIALYFLFRRRKR